MRIRQLRAWLVRLTGFYGRQARDREFQEELESHLQMHVDDYVRDGMSPQEARRQALIKLGGVAQTEEAYRRGRGFPMLEDLWQDLRYGVRVLAKSRSFTFVAILTLALGVGANTAIFQLINAVRLRALPVPQPQELAEVRLADMEGARGNFASWHPALSNPIWEQVREHQQAFSGVFAWGAEDFNLGTGSEVRPARGLWVSGDFFDVLGVRPAMGRVLNATDDRRGCGTANAVISHQFWQREFGSDPSVIGKRLVVDDYPVEIIGVTPASFYGPEVGRSFDLAVPICSEALIRGADTRLDSGTDWWLIVMGRLKPNWSIEQATAQLNTISPGIFEATLSPKYPAESVKAYLGFKLTAFPAASGISQVRETYESPLWMLLAIAGLVLLIACANLANLLLARASAREREIAVRLALGASRARIVRQLLVESLLLSVIGSAVGAFLARFLGEFLVSLLSTQQDQLFIDLRPDWLVLGFTAGMALVTCLLFGLTPALRASRVAPIEAMKSSGRGLTAGRERFGLRRVLVVVQVALSLVLVVCALLFSRSFGKLLSSDVGFRQEGILIAQVDSSRLNLPEKSRLSFKRAMLERIKAVPGVNDAATANVIQLSGNAWNNDVWMDGTDPMGRKAVSLDRVSSGYFNTLGIAFIDGRDFNEHDTQSSPGVAIVNEEFARQIAGGAKPVGKSFWIEARPGMPETRYEIVGLVKSTKYNNVREDFQPVVYVPQAQASRFGQHEQFLISSNAPLSNLTAGVKQAIGELSPQSTIKFEVLREKIQNSLMTERLMATLSGFFGLLALTLACIGLYGIVSFGVASRTHEIGIRLALGAQARDVRLMILRESLLLVLVGVVVGLPVAFTAPRLVSAFLFGLTPADPVSISLAVFSLLIAALAGGYIPAMRATKVDPMIALRYE